MKLGIIHSTSSLQECLTLAEIYFKVGLKLKKIEPSIFEQYRLYLMEPKFIPELWSYRIVVNNKKYNFGKLQSL